MVKAITINSPFINDYSSQPCYNKNRLVLSLSQDNISLKYKFKNKSKLFLSQMT